MPIEIRELVIRAVVTEGPSESQKLERMLAGMKHEILEECSEKLHQLIRRSHGATER
jgi:Family of unknown function (DUF5908)